MEEVQKMRRFKLCTSVTVYIRKGTEKIKQERTSMLLLFGLIDWAGKAKGYREYSSITVNR